MRRYLSRRLFQGLFVVWAAFTITFLVLYALPSDPVTIMAGPNSNLTEEQLDARRVELGLDKPVIQQYVTQLGDLVQGDLGRSMQSRQEVTDIIRGGLGPTVKVAGAGLVLGIVFGGGIALLATYVRNRWLQQTLLSLPSVGIALPSFWIGLLLIQLFAFHWAWFPAIGDKGWKSIVLPAVTMALQVGPFIAQLLAKSLQATLHENYIDTARAKGASRLYIHFRHALRNAALPALTMIGLIAGTMLSSAVVIEVVFSRPGLGRIAADAVTAQDLPVVKGMVVFSAIVFVVVNLLVDLVYPLLDPRIVEQRAPRRAAATLGQAVVG